MRARARAAARHARRRPGDRQEPARLRALPDDRDAESSDSSSGDTGRSLPYGEGVTLLGARRRWSRRRRASSRPTRPRRPRRSFDEAVGAVVADGGRRAWVERHLRPLAGLETRRHVDGRSTRRGVRGVAALPRGARPASGRSFSCSRTCTGPTMRCSTSSTTSSSGRAACRSSSSAPPVPSCLTRRPGWGGGKVNSSTILLSAALGRRDGSSSCTSLLEKSALPGDSQARLLERAAGNPLYAEEFMRMLADAAGAAVRAARRRFRASSPHGSTRFAARRRRCCRTGPFWARVFWLGALGERAPGARGEAALARAEGVRRHANGARTVDGEVEYAFRHVLVRDVAYEQIPRADAGREASVGGELDRVARAAGGSCRDCSPTTIWPRSSYRALARATDVEPHRRRGRVPPCGTQEIEPSPSTRSLRRRSSTSACSSSRPATQTPRLLLRYGRALAVSRRRPRGAECSSRPLRGTARATGTCRGRRGGACLLTEALQYQGRPRRAPSTTASGHVELAA